MNLLKSSWRRRVERRPAIAPRLHLDPRVRIGLAHDVLLRGIVVFHGQVTGNESDRNTDAVAQGGKSGREILAVAALRLKEKLNGRIDGASADGRQGDVAQVRIVGELT